ncbi:MAG: DUF1343 domain-containing protein [Chlamydiae bacterium]|nr:DUF1343 domain-containing protein [Chlamydiota bacterium]
MNKAYALFIFLFIPLLLLAAEVELGVDQFFKDPAFYKKIKGKNIGLITNHTAINKKFCPTIDYFKKKSSQYGFKIVALFSPEHGLSGAHYAAEKVEEKNEGDLRIYSLHGKDKRPSGEMLKEIDLLIYDIQEIGSRTYTYASTLFYAMEAAAAKKIPVIVLDRPNPMGGIIVDGPMLQEKWRSFIGYINVPYCHGMTIGELALFFNHEYKIGCPLVVIPMKGWKRSMTFMETGLQWIPTSPYIPEPDTPFFYASTGVLGALSIVNIGIGYTMPFKLIGAPWINGIQLAEKLNKQKLPGVHFVPICYRPFYGKFKGELCQGVKIVITDFKSYYPMKTQYLLIGMLKTIYPKEFKKRLQELSNDERKMFCHINGNEKIYYLLLHEKYAAWKLIQFEEAERQQFLEKRQKYLLY